MTIAGQTFTVNQAAPCTYSVAPLGQTIAAPGGTGTPVTVTTQTGCTWSAVSHDAWITITSGASGSGTGTVHLTVAANGECGPSWHLDGCGTEPDGDPEWQVVRYAAWFEYQQ